MLDYEYQQRKHATWAALISHSVEIILLKNLTQPHRLPLVLIRTIKLHGAFCTLRRLQLMSHQLLQQQLGNRKGGNIKHGAGRFCAKKAVISKRTADSSVPMLMTADKQIGSQ